MGVMAASLQCSMSVVAQDEHRVVLSLGGEDWRLILSAQPFRLDIMEGPQVLLSLNSRGLLAFEQLRIRKDTWVAYAVLHVQDETMHLYHMEQCNWMRILDLWWTLTEYCRVIYVV